MPHAEAYVVPTGAGSFAVPAEYGLVAASLASICFLNLWQYLLVVSKRKASGVPYPIMMATPEQAEKSLAARQFNGAQRAHHNTLEGVPTVVPAMLISGLLHPRLAAAAGLAFVVGRISYTRGYITGDPKKRLGGLSLLGSAGFVSVYLLVAYTSWEMVKPVLKF